LQGFSFPRFKSLQFQTAMKPLARTDARQLDLFKAQFSQILNPYHPLLILAEKIDWKRFDAALADCFCVDFGAAALATQLIVGLLYLKNTFAAPLNPRLGTSSKTTAWAAAS